MSRQLVNRQEVHAQCCLLQYCCYDGIVLNVGNTACAVYHQTPRLQRLQ